MNKKYCIIGAGKQGTAAAYDLVKFAKINSLLLIDTNKKSIDKCLLKIKSVIGDCKVETSIIDINDENKLCDLLKDQDVFLSSVPYSFNLMLTEVAIKSKTSMVDLGGHTGNVIKQLKYNEDAKKSQITIVPDCGMGPGMNITMALYAMEHLEDPKEVCIWDGGLPKNPTEPWNYSLFFNIQGLTNEYDECAFFLRDGEIVEVPCFEDIEILDFGDKIGKLEAAVTSGGLSTMPWTFENKLEKLENKTLRYFGHWEWMKAYRQLGLFSEDKIQFQNQEIVPREFYHHLLEPQLDTKDLNDRCIMRVESIGMINNEKYLVQVDCVEEYDEESGFMAMEKWTGWHASIVMQHIGNGNLSYGTYPIEKALSGHDFYKQAMKRNYSIKVNKTKLD